MCKGFLLLLSLEGEVKTQTMSRLIVMEALITQSAAETETTVCPGPRVWGQTEPKEES